MKFTIGQVESLVKLLNNVHEQPGIYAEDVGIAENIPHSATTFNSVRNFIKGVKATLEALGVDYPQQLEDSVATERGWELSAGSPIYAMLDKQMTESAIIDELLTIMIKTLKKQYGIE
ncbi:MAG: hypothetical protein RLP44_01070 [Aggregatilineales bacterium]